MIANSCNIGTELVPKSVKDLTTAYCSIIRPGSGSGSGSSKSVQYCYQLPRKLPSFSFVRVFPFFSFVGKSTRLLDF